MTEKPKIIVILGPTATGKSDLAVALAKKIGGEIISADSRQVYKGLDTGTGKITKREMRDVPHHLLDVASPKKIFSVNQFKNLAEKTIEKILDRQKIPIICGGTGFYIQALVDNISLPEVPPDLKLRKKLEAKTPEQLFVILSKLDPDRARVIDKNNHHRLIRSIEIATVLGKMPKTKTEPKYESLQIGLDAEDFLLKEKISKRLMTRMKKGMVEEARKLHAVGLPWKRMESLGLEYRYLARFLQNKISEPELLSQLSTKIWRYAKRQRTWFKRDPRIHWFRPDQKKEIEKTVSDFLK